MKDVKVLWLGSIACNALILAFVVASPASAQSPSVAAGFQERILGDKEGLKVVAWFKPQASLGDDDWFQIEIVNRGVAGTISSLKLVAPAQSNGSFNGSDVLASLMIGVNASGREYTSVGRTVPAGTYITREPGVYLGASLGAEPGNYFGTALRTSTTSLDVTMRLDLRFTLTDGRSFSTPAPVSIAFRWLPPNTARMAALRKQAVTLIERAIPGELSSAEVHLRRALVQDLRTAEDVSLELALTAIKTRQVEGSFRFHEVRALVFRRWPTDPRVIAFYREALESRGPEALSDLPGVVRGFWDESFVEPIVQLIAAAPARDRKFVLHRGLTVLDAHYASWATDPSIAPRLSNAVLRFSPEEIVNGMYVWAEMLSLTHDRGAINSLLPYLADQRIDLFTSRSSNMPTGTTPMRYSEVAANAICRLLGEPIMFDPYRRAAMPKGAEPILLDINGAAVVSKGGPYPEWAEWDKKIAALRERLAKLGYRAPLSGS